MSTGRGDWRAYLAGRAVANPIEGIRGLVAAYPLIAGALLFAIALAVGLLGGYAFAATPLVVGGAILGTLAVLSVVQHLQFGLYAALLVATLLPFGVLPLPLGGFQITFLELTLGLTLALLILRAVLAPDQSIVVTPVGLLVIVFVGVTAVAFANGMAYGFSTADFRQYLKGALGATAFFVVLNGLRGPVDGRRLLVVLAAGAAAAALVGIGIFLLPREDALATLNGLGPLGYPTGSGLLRYHVESERLRAVGTSIDPNAFGALLMVAGALVFGQAIAPSPLVPRWWLVAVLPPIVVGLLLTLSRSSWVGAAAGICFLLLVRYRRFWPFFLAATVAAAAVFFLGLERYFEGIPFLGRYVGHLFTGLRAGDQATLMRLGEYKDALQLISLYPLLGVGYSQAPTVDLYIGVSSLYLLLAENAGLLGLGAYLAAVAATFAYTLRGVWRRRDQGLAWLALGSLGALTAALAAGIFDHPFVNARFAHLVALFWMVAGLAVWSARTLNSSPKLDA